MQTRLQSFIESMVNILIGYTVAILSQLIVFPFFDIHIPLSSNLWIGFYFTLISLLRSYLIRRWYNRAHSDKLDHVDFDQDKDPHDPTYRP